AAAPARRRAAAAPRSSRRRLVPLAGGCVGAAVSSRTSRSPLGGERIDREGGYAAAERGISTHLRDELMPGKGGVRRASQGTLVGPLRRFRCRGDDRVTPRCCEGLGDRDRRGTADEKVNKGDRVIERTS